jgi:hypothetical protein
MLSISPLCFELGVSKDFAFQKARSAHLRHRWSHILFWHNSPIVWCPGWLLRLDSLGKIHKFIHGIRSGLEYMFLSYYVDWLCLMVFNFFLCNVVYAWVSSFHQQPCSAWLWCLLQKSVGEVPRVHVHSSILWVLLVKKTEHVESKVLIWSLVRNHISCFWLTW